MFTQEFIGTIDGGPLRSITWRHRLPSLRPGIDVSKPPWHCNSIVTHMNIEHATVGASRLGALRRAIRTVSFELAVAVRRGATLFIPDDNAAVTPELLATCFQNQPTANVRLSDVPDTATLQHVIASAPLPTIMERPLHWMRSAGTRIALVWSHAPPTRVANRWHCLGWVEGTTICTQTTAQSSLLAMIASMRQIHFALLNMIKSGERIHFPFEDEPITSEFFDRSFGFSEASSLATITTPTKA